MKVEIGMMTQSPRSISHPGDMEMTNNLGVWLCVANGILQRMALPGCLKNPIK